MWWITIIIDVLLVVLAFVFCNVYYNKHYGGNFGPMSLNVLRTHEVIEGKILDVMPGFSNFSCNVLLKCIVTIICIVIIHFSDSLWITYLYMPYLLLTYWVFKNRVQHYNAQTPDNKHFIKPALVASFTLPLFQTIFMISLYITYFFNT